MILNKINLSSFFFLYSLMFIPFFNDLPLLIGVSNSLRSISYFFLFGMILFYIIESLYIKKFILDVPLKIIILIFALLVSSLISIIVNIEFSGYIIANKNSFMHMITNEISMIFKYILLVFSIHYINSISPITIKKYIHFGFFLTTVYVIFEIVTKMIPFYLFDSNYLNLFTYIDSIVHERVDDIGSRSRGLSFEPSYQVVVLVFLLPFVFQKGKYLFLIILGLIATLSPTAMVSLLYFYIFYKYKGLKLLLVNSVLLAMFILFLANININIDDSMTSTITRFGSWIASLSLIQDNFFFGVGPGMGGYWQVFHYPDFFYLSTESELWYLSGIEKFNAPSFASILSFITDYGLFPILLVSIYFYKYKVFHYIYNVPIARASIVALSIASLGLSSFGFLGFMVFFAITITKRWHLFDERRCLYD